MIVLMIKSHDKYQSLILIGLARAEKVNSGIRSILVYYRSYWRELRPLVTPWGFCIKEGIEPWKSQKWFNPCIKEGIEPWKSQKWFNPYRNF